MKFPLSATTHILRWAIQQIADAKVGSRKHVGARSEYLLDMQGTELRIILRDTSKPNDYSREEVVQMLGTVREAEARMGWRAPDPRQKKRPVIVCLCGSTKFREEYRQVVARETLAGKIVLSVGCFHGDPEWGTNKVNLDELHKRKIELADEVLVIDKDGYIGESTRNEIIHAVMCNKPVHYEFRDKGGLAHYGN